MASANFIETKQSPGTSQFAGQGTVPITTLQKEDMESMLVNQKADEGSLAMEEDQKEENGNLSSESPGVRINNVDSSYHR